MDGQVADLPGDPPTRVRVLHTPGHARGHLCFHIESLNALIAGDMVSGVSTIVIDPPEGNMGDYLDSLACLEALNPATLFPSHGSATPYAAGTLRAVRLHRLQREQKILDVWNSGTRAPAEIVAQVYSEIEASLHSIAERQVQAHLEHLTSIGKI
jgi:glyoxylase-like metal-dependent hydrolase (beta-lactamase superfamily II)